MLDWTGLITYSGTVGCWTMQWFGWVDSRWGWVGWSDWMQRELPFKVKFNLVWVELPWKYVCHGVHRLQQAGLPTASSSIFLLQTWKLLSTVLLHICLYHLTFLHWLHLWDLSPHNSAHCTVSPKSGSKLFLDGPLLEGRHTLRLTSVASSSPLCPSLLCPPRWSGLSYFSPSLPPLCRVSSILHLSCHFYLKLDCHFAPTRPRHPVEVLPQAAEEVCCGKNLIFFKVEQVFNNKLWHSHINLNHSRLGRRSPSSGVAMVTMWSR